MRHKESHTEVVFLDVGQGDAILIQEGSIQILIDGGGDGRLLLARLGRYVPFWDRTLEAVIATHPDRDHIGGFPDLLRAYRVEAVLANGQAADSDTYRAFEAGARAETERVYAAAKGVELELPSGAKLSFEYPLWPLPEGADGPTNDGSIVSRFVFGGTSFLLTGDLSSEERHLADTPASVLKVAHHGSNSSTSAGFLQMIRPREAVISVGNNTYGHPHPDVLARLEAAGTRVRRTDREGSICYLCWRETGRCEVSE